MSELALDRKEVCRDADSACLSVVSHLRSRSALWGIPVHRPGGGGAGGRGATGHSVGQRERYLVTRLLGLIAGIKPQTSPPAMTPD